MTNVPSRVLAAYGLQKARLAYIPSLINSTFVAQIPGSTERVVLQRLHPVFGPRVNEDIEALTLHLHAKGMDTPRLLKTGDGNLWVTANDESNGEIWRAQTFVEGLTKHKDCSPAALQSAAQLLARFHSETMDFNHQFVHSRPLHDTPARLEQLAAALNSPSASHDTQAQNLGASILRQAERIRVEFSSLPRRVIHGDPKISNLLFWPDEPERARCLIDLDTVGRGPLAVELGDALRSWTNPAGEDVAQASVQVDLFAAAVEGYRMARHSSIGADELASFVDGLETISLELACRYATDVIVDEYFGWDKERFASRREHNILRAQGQLALSRDVAGKRQTLEALALGQ